MKRKHAFLSCVLSACLLMQSIAFASPDKRVQSLSLENQGDIVESASSISVSNNGVDDALSDKEEVEKYIGTSSSKSISDKSDTNIQLMDTASDRVATVKDLNGKVDLVFSVNILDKTSVQKQELPYNPIALSDSIYVYATLTNISQSAVAENISIPSTVRFKYSGDVDVPVRLISPNAFENSSITGVTIPDSVYEIGDKAFYNCPKLKSVIANGPADGPVWYDAFASEYNYMDTTIGVDVFSECASLTSATIHGYDVIKNNVFYNDRSLKNVDISNSGKYHNRIGGETNDRYIAIKDNAFYNCSSLETLTLDDTVDSIGDKTFWGCTSLKTLNIGSRLRNIDYSDFLPKPSFSVDSNYFEYLATKDSAEPLHYDQYLAIQADMEKSNSSFDEFACKKLQNINVSSENTDLNSKDGVLYNDRWLLYCPLDTNINSVELNNQSIDVCAFYKNNKIKNVTLTGNQKVVVEDYAFTDSTSLQTLNLNSTGENVVGVNSCFNCSSLTTLGVQYLHYGKIYKAAFACCPKLVNVDLYAFDEIQSYAFANIGASKLVFKDGIRILGDYVFMYCPNLTEVDMTYLLKNCYKNERGSIGIGMFKYCRALKKAALSSGMLGISSDFFMECTSLETVTSENIEDLAEIGSCAFYNCTSLKSFPKTRFLVNIDTFAFYNCSSLSSIDLTRSVMTIADNAFEGTSIKINAPAGSKAKAFAEANNIPSGTIADDIQDYEFLVYGTAKYENGNRVFPPKYDKEVGCGSYSTFKVMKELSPNYFNSLDIVIVGYRGGFESLTIDATDTDHVFGNEICYGDSYFINNPYSGNTSTCSMKKFLKHLEMKGIVYIGESSFEGAALEGTLYLPHTLYMIDKYAFYGCENLKAVDTDLSVINDFTDKDFIISEKAFAKCYALESFNNSFLQRDISSLESGKQSSVINYTLRRIEKDAFWDCKSLKNVYFNGNLAYVGDYCFENCTALETVNIVDSTYLGYQAFYGCTGMKNAILAGEVNIANSNDPFCHSKGLKIVTTNTSKAKGYVDFKNQTLSGDDVFTLEEREFADVNGKSYLQSIVVADKSIKVTKNGTVMSDTTEGNKNYVYCTDVLKFEPVKAVDGKIYTFFINGTMVDDTYTVPEYIPTKLVITMTEVDETTVGDVNGDGSVLRNDYILMAKYFSGYKVDVIEKNMDINGDGNVQRNDYVLMSKYFAGYDSPYFKK